MQGFSSENLGDRRGRDVCHLPHQLLKRWALRKDALLSRTGLLRKPSARYPTQADQQTGPNNQRIIRSTTSVAWKPRPTQATQMLDARRRRLMQSPVQPPGIFVHKQRIACERSSGVVSRGARREPRQRFFLGSPIGTSAPSPSLQILFLGKTSALLEIDWQPQLEEGNVMDEHRVAPRRAASRRVVKLI